MLSVSVLFFYVYTYIMYTLIFIGLHILLICPSCRLTDCLRESICLSLEEGDEDLMVVSLGKLFLNATSMLKAFKSYCTRQVCHISYLSIFLYIFISVCPSLCMYVCTYVCMYLSINLSIFFLFSTYLSIHQYISNNRLIVSTYTPPLQGSASALLGSLEREKELLRIFLKVSQMENTVLRRMNLSSFLMVSNALHM